MAELRAAENRLIEVTQSYNSVCHDARLEGRLPALEKSLLIHIVNSNDIQSPPPASKAEASASYTDLLARLQGIEQHISELQPTMEKFQKRLAEKDPITSKPRYGEKTQNRVIHLLDSYQEIQQNILALTFLGDEHNNPPCASLITVIREQASQEEVQAKQTKQRQIEEQQAAKEQAALQERQALEAQQQAERQAQQEEERRLEELRRQRQEARDAERRARQEQERADRDWVNRIPKGPNSVQKQLDILLEATREDLVAQQVAVQALHAIFAQICARPEEPDFRRIRRGNPQFLQDIGRHKGGKELFVAAGFELAEIDGVPSFLCKEPNLETDMDKWSEWFDLLKATLKILENHLAATKRKR